jgi:hypothetical protein
VDDRQRVLGLVGRRVEVGVRGENGGEGAAHLVATLDEVRDDGVELSEISELGPGPTLFCPWDSLNRYGEWMPWLGELRERPRPGEEPQEYYDLYEWREPTAEDVVPEPRGRQPSARILERVVPIAQRETVGEVTVALTSLELFGKRLGILRYRISYVEGMFEGGYGIPEPQLVIRDESGRELPWSPRGNGSSGSEAEGEMEVRDLPEKGELEVEVTRLESLAFDEEAGEEVATDFCEGPWTFRFSI